MEDLLREQFGFSQIEITQLAGYDNLNYLVKTDQGDFIFKTYENNQGVFDLIEAENKALCHLAKDKEAGIPRPLSFKDGSFVQIFNLDGEERICRMLTFLNGTFLGDSTSSKELLRSLGTFLANLDKKLQTFQSYVIQSRQWEWNLSNLDLIRKYLDAISDPNNHKVVLYFLQQYDVNVRPVLPQLRKSIIHNDANEWNILVSENEVTGIIDFGDLAHSELISELAVAATYVAYDKESPLEWIEPVLSSYHAVFPLEEIEIAVLYYLIAARLCISVCSSAHSRQVDPNNTYALSSEKNAWKMLNKWLELGSVAAENSFREAVGFAPLKTKELQDVVDERHQSISSIFSISYKKPIYMNGAAFQYMYDTYGNSYLDAYNNIPHVGHSHPKVVEAGQRQMAALNTNTRYLYDQLNQYAEKLLSKFPRSLSKVHFVNSGSAASDLAIRLAKAHTRNSLFAVMEHGYHGNTQMAIDVSDYKFSHKAGQGQKDYIDKLPIPDMYRGTYTGPEAGLNYANEAVREIERLESSLAAFIAEPIVGCGGQVPLADGYLETLYPAIRERGGVCISDEVQTGFGRLGDYFWGFEKHGVIPDIVILGKPMGNGHPIGAVVTTEEISNSFSQGVEFFSSFGGNPVSCAIGQAVLEVIEEEGLQENAAKVGEYYQSLLNQLKSEFAVIGDVRGSGLFIGVELVKEDEEPNTDLAQVIKNELRNQHILVSTDGPFDNVIKSKPPMCFTRENAEQVIDAFRQVFKNN